MRVIAGLSLLFLLNEGVICWTGAWNPKVVTRFDGLDKFYLQLREKNPLSDEMNKLNKEDGDLFCKTLSYTRYFAVKLEQHANINSEETISELWNFRRSIINHIYEDYDKFQFCLLILGPQCLYQYTFKELTVRVGNTHVRESLHMCMLKEGQSQTFKQYFVSRPYQTRMNDSRRNNIAFLFTYTPTNDELVLEALIEEAAVDHAKVSKAKRKRMEDDYLWLRDSHIGMKIVDDDDVGDQNTVCQLPENAKLRLCASVMNMPIYKHAYKFWPGKFNVMYTCEKRKISFTRHIKEIHEEWSVGCKVTENATKKTTYFFISQDNQCDTTVSVYVDHKGMLAMMGQGRHVTVLY